MDISKNQYRSTGGEAGSPEANHATTDLRRARLLHGGVLRIDE